jgi:type III restriction enzyme
LAQGTGAIIENPVINTPFAEPGRHFVMEDGKPTGEIADRRRPSEFFIPVPPPRRKSAAQLTLDHYGQIRQQPNEIVNEIRQAVARWRQQGYPHTTSVTKDLLAYWQDEDRQRRLFFCQIEAAETAIYLAEAAERTGDTNALNQIRAQNAQLNGGLPRTALKMATGSGKTVVMAMLIAWQALNKQANPQDRRFSDRFLIVTPGITIRDRLRVLLPNDPQNYYQDMDLVGAEQIDRLKSATILITNYHAFIRREKIKAAGLTKRILSGGASDDRFKESPAEMVRRVCRDFGTAKGIVVINDEAHHCYAPAPPEKAEEGTLDVEERTLARENAEEARVWIGGLQAVQEKLGVRSVLDLSATPFFLNGSGYKEGTLFPWVVSDFGLMDAIESGIVKIPRVPTSDDSMTGTSPMYRDLWSRVKDALPRKGRRGSDDTLDPELIPKELEGALMTLYADYQRSFDEWADAGIGTPPVFIVVCSNTATSKLVYDWIAGYDKELDNGVTVMVPGKLGLFTNEQGGAMRDRPNTILVDSAQLDRGDALEPAFRKAAHAEIEAFKREYVARFPGRSAEEITDEDILREVMNTVGKKDRLGEHVRCVVSVAMLTEGWDANTVTHILGIRAFGTQLLCEQVVGRALRRASYDADENGMFDPQYAEVYGVPFSFLLGAGKGKARPAKPVQTVRALPERAELRIEFPRLIGYRYQLPVDRLDARFDASSILPLSTQDVALKTEVDPIVGLSETHTLDDLREQRMQTVVFAIAKRTLALHFRDDEGGERPWLFPQLLRITRDWIAECVTPYLKDGAFEQLLLFVEYGHAAAERIRQAIVAGTAGEKRLLPVLRPYEPIGSTDYVFFETTKTCYQTTKSHINRMVEDSGWESKLADVLESMPEVVAYAKNQGLNFKIPYTYEGRPGNYVPDFLIRLRDADSTGPNDLLTLVLEVSGEARKDKQAKVATAEHLWAPAVNNWGAAGRWAFLEITDPWDAKNLIESHFIAGVSTRA